jgi:hypothetical protein
MSAAALSEAYSSGPKDWQEVFNNTCVKTHWDPTMVVQHILPKFQHTMAMDPRPSTRNCYVYYNSSPGDAPTPTYPQNTPPPIPDYLLGGPHRPIYPVVGLPPTSQKPVFPPGGQASISFPYMGYEDNVNKESVLFILNEDLSRCANKKYIPPGGHPPPGMATNHIPGASFANSTTLSPGVNTVLTKTGCRAQDDELAWNRSARLFFNPTKYDTTITDPPDLYKPSSHNALVCPITNVPKPNPRTTTPVKTLGSD